jgi:DNA helicase II / ATP-dependent DNA helicase PcrA
MDELIKQLNPSQLAAVTTTDGPLLVIAGAGSGKTRVIEYRVLHLVKKNIPPESILLLTFTRRAAREMLSRAEKHDSRCQNIDGGTFHSFAFKILKRYAKAIGFSDSFSILDESDAEEAVQRCLFKVGGPEKDKRFPKKSTLKSVISASINKAKPIEDILDKEYPHFTEYAPIIEKVRKEYASYKISKNYLDYDDLLVYLRLLLEKDEIRMTISRKYKYVMVDEYQDTNKLQGDISYLLAMDHTNIMVVGDDAQSIYGFRGSSHENIMAFPKRFKSCRVIKLEENYRSVQPILDVANAVLENMNNRYSKCLSSVRQDDADRPRLLFFKDAYQEAESIANMISQLCDEGESFSDIAVLFRSAYVSIPLQAELSKRNITYQVFGGLKFYETAHVKDAISHLKTILNPKDELAWNRVLTLLDGVGPKNADRLTEEIVSSVSIRAAIENVFAKYEHGTRFGPGLKRLAAFLKNATAFKLSPGALYGIVLDYYTPMMKDKFDDWHLRTNDLEALRQISAKYESLEDLLADFSIEPPDRSVLTVEGEAADDDEPLTLSTIHSAKGLEWKHVFLMGVVDGLLPISFALNYEDEIEEESRLFYVAVTRARDKLVLSLHHEGSRGGMYQFNKISRFVDQPNVLSALDQNVVLEPESGDSSRWSDDNGEVQLYDKDKLLENIIDSWE